MLEIVDYKRDEYSFPALLVLGCFDAIHIGHAELLKKAKLQAKINGLDFGVMMFAEGKGGRQVFTFEERLQFLAAYNTKFVLRIDYTDEFRGTTAAEFLSTLENFINIKAYMSGKDFRFGAGAKGKSSTLKNYADDEDNAVWYMAVKDLAVDGEKVSTTLIKRYIEEGRIQKANALLGREYFVSGTVAEGNGRGGSIGYPTANVVYPENKVFVARGVYGVEVEFDGEKYRGVANFGARPTFGENSDVLEAHLIGYDGSLYGKTVTVKFLNYIRGIRKFVSPEELAAQIACDIAEIGAPDRDPAEEVAPAVEVVSGFTEFSPAEISVAEAEQTPEEVQPLPEEVSAEQTEEPAAEEVLEEAEAEQTPEEAQPLPEEVTAEQTEELAAEEVLGEAETEQISLEEVTSEQSETETCAREPEEIAEEAAIQNESAEQDD